MATIRWKVGGGGVIITKSDGTELTLTYGDCFMIPNISVPNQHYIGKVNGFRNAGEGSIPKSIFFLRWRENEQKWGSQYELNPDQFDGINKTPCPNQGGGGSRKKRKLRKTRRHSTRRHSTRRHSTRR